MFLISCLIDLILKIKYKIIAPNTFKIKSSISHEPDKVKNCNPSINNTTIIMVGIKILNLFCLLNINGRKKENGIKATILPIILYINI